MRAGGDFSSGIIFHATLSHGSAFRRVMRQTSACLNSCVRSDSDISLRGWAGCTCYDVASYELELDEVWLPITTGPAAFLAAPLLPSSEEQQHSQIYLIASDAPHTAATRVYQGWRQAASDCMVQAKNLQKQRSRE
jgi:hypothetical protein